MNLSMTRMANNFNSKRCAVIGMMPFKIPLRTTQFASTFNGNMISGFLLCVNLLSMGRFICFLPFTYAISMLKIVTMRIFFELFRVHLCINLMSF